jgi:MPBQ/MSBQ methyltransferase
MESGSPVGIVGLDASKEQVQRAQSLAARDSGICFVQGRADAMPFATARFSAVYSVEAAQHFPSLSPFLEEAFRVLKPGGRIALTTFFGKSSTLQDELVALIPTIAKGIDFIHPVEALLVGANAAGFRSLKCQSIGENVWKGLDSWLEQTLEKHSWGRNWYRAYEKQYLDYYLFSATKP